MPPNSPLSDAEHFGVVGGLWVKREGPHAEGHVHVGLTHHVDHGMFLEEGAVRIVWKDSLGAGTVLVTAPNWIPIPGDGEHNITSLRDGTRWWCVFPAEPDNV